MNIDSEKLTEQLKEQFQKIKTPLSDAQRQQRRRDKLKAEKEKERFNPAPVLGRAVQALRQEGALDDKTAAALEAKALELFKAEALEQDLSPVTRNLNQKFFELQLHEYLSCKSDK